MPALDFDDFRRALKKGEIQPAYLFYGDEDLLKHDALTSLVDAALEPSTRDFNLEKRRGADLTAEAFETLALTPPILAARRVVIITEAEDLLQRRSRAQAARASLLSYLARPASETLLVLVQSAQTEADGELQRLCTSVCFSALTPERLRRWIQHRAAQEKLQIGDEAATHLHDAVGDDLGQLASEIAKLASAVRDREATVDDVADLVGVRRGETAHDFVDAVTGRQFTAALSMLGHILETPGNSAVRLLISLGTALTGVAVARAQLDRGGSRSAARNAVMEALNAGRPFGLRPWSKEADRWSEDAASWTAAALDAALQELLNADRRLKSTALDDDVRILRGALLAMAGRETRAA